MSVYKLARDDNFLTSFVEKGFRERNKNSKQIAVLTNLAIVYWREDDEAVYYLGQRIIFKEKAKKYYKLYKTKLGQEILKGIKHEKGNRHTVYDLLTWDFSKGSPECN